MKKLIGIAAILALAIPSVAFAKLLTIKVSPSKVKAGKSVTLSGSVGSKCPQATKVTLYSQAFKKVGVGVPYVVAKIGKGGKYSIKTTLPKKDGAFGYGISGRCGPPGNGTGTLFATGNLTVVK